MVKRKRSPKKVLPYLIVGLDLSLSCTGVAYFDCQLEEKILKRNIILRKAIEIKPADKTRYERARDVSQEIILYITKYCLPFHRIYFFFEDYSYGAKGGANSLAYLGELCGIIKSQVMAKYQTEMIPVSIGTWKKFLANNGSLKKDEFKLAIYKKFGIECKTNDEAAAIGVTYFGYNVIARALEKCPEERLFNYEETALKNFFKKPSPELKNEFPIIN